MKKINIVLTALILMLISSGCATSGRFSVIDLDLRSPEQIEAFYGESKVPYNLTLGDSTDAEVEAEVQVDSKSISIWSFIAPILEALDGRLRIFSFEWKDKK